MTHIFGHIECGGLGRFLGWRRLWFRIHEVLTLGIHLDHEALVEKYGATEDDAAAFGREIHEFIQGKYKEAKERWGVPYYNHQPHPANYKAKLFKKTPK
jgi:hypothetical protein